MTRTPDEIAEIVYYARIRADIGKPGRDRDMIRNLVAIYDAEVSAHAVTQREMQARIDTLLQAALTAQVELAVTQRERDQYRLAAQLFHNGLVGHMNAGAIRHDLIEQAVALFDNLEERRLSSPAALSPSEHEQEGTLSRVEAQPTRAHGDPRVNPNEEGSNDV